MQLLSATWLESSYVDGKIVSSADSIARTAGNSFVGCPVVGCSTMSTSAVAPFEGYMEIINQTTKGGKRRTIESVILRGGMWLRIMN